jgi:uncharacterized protein
MRRRLSMRDHAAQVAKAVGLERKRVAAAIALFDAGNTIPFVARYRKEATGGLDEMELREIAQASDAIRRLEQRRETILASLTEQGLLTPELAAQVGEADSLTRLEDLYRPYRPKRRTRASVARERGLQGLADLILKQVLRGSSAETLAEPFLSAAVPTAEDALAGARDIVAEVISDDADVRQRVRENAFRRGELASSRIAGSEDERGVYETYYGFRARVNSLRPHQVLALNRGEAADVLRVSLEVSERVWLPVIRGRWRPDPRSPMAPHLTMAIDDAAARLLLPAVERDVRRTLTERAEERAIQVFATNLRNLLSQPPLVGRTVLGLDPGYRTGCKVAVVDDTGRVLDTATIYPHSPQGQWDRSRETLLSLVARYGVDLIAIGDGTASRESQQLAVDVIGEAEGDLAYLVVSEAGASVYSASELARQELLGMDVSLRGAVSIARRVQDPLAELVKIDPRSIGVGMYQHDVDQGDLSSALDDVVESVVNRVGVDLNTASIALLGHVAGIGPRLAERIVAYRDENGAFRKRAALRRVKGLGPKTFLQAAGFLRIRHGEEPLDRSAIHPESYDVARALLKRADIPLRTPPRAREDPLRRLLEQRPKKALAAELGTGVPTLDDIVQELIRPGRDPRESLPPPVLRDRMMTIEELEPGMCLRGTVRNVVDFGAFVDVGVKEDGLLHVSQFPQDETLATGDSVTVVVLRVEPERGRIGLGWPQSD